MSSALFVALQYSGMQGRMSGINRGDRINGKEDEGYYLGSTTDTRVTMENQMGKKMNDDMATWKVRSMGP